MFEWWYCIYAKTLTVDCFFTNIFDKSASYGIIHGFRSVLINWELWVVEFPPTF